MISDVVRSLDRAAEPKEDSTDIYRNAVKDAASAMSDYEDRPLSVSSVELMFRQIADSPQNVFFDNDFSRRRGKEPSYS